MNQEWGDIDCQITRPEPCATWRGSLTLLGDGGRDAFEAIEELLGYLERLAQTGAFADSQAHRKASGLWLDTRRSDGRLDVAFSAKHLHPGFWRSVLQMLWHCHAMEPFRVLRLVPDEAQPSDRHGPSVILEADYPPLPPTESIKRVVEESAFVGDFEVQLTLTQDLPSGDLAVIEQLVDDWGTVVYTGGFTDVGEVIDEPLLDKPAVYCLSRREVQVSVTHWEGTPPAVTALLSLLQALSERFSILRMEAR